MNQYFKKALEAGHVEIEKLPTGEDFVCEGVTYYRCSESGTNFYAGRFAGLGDTLRHHDELKLSRDLLGLSLDTLIDLGSTGLARVNDPKAVIDVLSEMRTLAMRLRERQSVGLSIEMIYDIMGVCYMDESEDPRSISLSHNAKKTRAWAKDPALLDFFLATPFKRFVPFDKLLAEDTLACIREETYLEWLDWSRIALKFGPDGLMNSTLTGIESRRETLQSFDTSLRVPLNLTTTT